MDSSTTRCSSTTLPPLFASLTISVLTRRTGPTRPSRSRSVSGVRSEERIVFGCSRNGDRFAWAKTGKLPAEARRVNVKVRFNCLFIDRTPERIFVSGSKNRGTGRRIAITVCLSFWAKKSEAESRTLESKVQTAKLWIGDANCDRFGRESQKEAT